MTPDYRALGLPKTAAYGPAADRDRLYLKPRTDVVDKADAAIEELTAALVEEKAKVERLEKDSRNYWKLEAEQAKAKLAAVTEERDRLKAELDVAAVAVITWQRKCGTAPFTKDEVLAAFSEQARLTAKEPKKGNT